MSATLSANLTTPTPKLKPLRYHPALVALHWLIALFIAGAALFALGGGDGDRGGITIAGLPIFGVHMILGITVLVLLVVRLILRWRTQRPDWATTGNAFLDKIGELTHWALYLFTFAITITGLILALQTNRLARVFNPGTTPRAQITPGQLQSGQIPSAGQFQLGQLVDRVERRFSEGGGFSLGAFHGLSWVLLFLLILLHVAAALYHQFFVNDNLLGRMWFGKPAARS